MRITSQFGLNIQVPLHSSQHGLHYLKLVLVHHYSTIIPSWMPEVAETFDIPSNWKLRAQLVFSSIEAAAGEKPIWMTLRFKTFN